MHFSHIVVFVVPYNKIALTYAKRVCGGARLHIYMVGGCVFCVMLVCRCVRAYACIEMEGEKGTCGVGGHTAAKAKKEEESFYAQVL